MTDELYERFCNNELFSGLSQDEIKTIYSLTDEIDLNNGEFLVHEGEIAKDLFFMIDGMVDVIRLDPKTKEKFAICSLKNGDVVGEFALIDRGKRSASVQATAATRLRRLAFADLRKLADQDKNYFTIYLKLSENLTKKLRNINDAIVEMTKKELAYSRIHEHMGRFLIYVIVILSVMTYSLPWLRYALAVVPNTSYVSIPMILFFSLFVFEMIKFSHFPLFVFGITLENWKRSLLEGIVFSIPVLFFAVFGKWFLIHSVPGWEGHHLFEPFAVIPGKEDQTLLYWVFANLIYWCFIPVQELMARGVLQGLLEQFLIGKRRVLVSILISNLMFSTVHLFFSTEVGLFVLIGGLFWGWLYHRSHNLIGVIASHCIIGTWFFTLGPVF